MATNLGSIYAEMRLKLDTLQSDLNSANAMFNQADQKVQESAQKQREEYDKAVKAAQKTTEKVGQAMVQIGTVMTAVGATASLGIKGLVTAAADWETAFAGVKKTVDEVEDSNGNVILSYDDLEQSLRDLAKVTPATASEIAGVAEAAGQLGIKTEDVSSFTETMIKLGVSTNMSAEEAATALARFSNIMGTSSDDVGRLGSSVVALGNNFAATETEIVNMGLRLAAAGDQIGLSEADVMGISTALTSLGIKAEMGGSAFSKAMINMQVATSTGLEPAREVVEKTGMSIRDLELMSANASSDFKGLAQSIGMTSDELDAVIKNSKNLEDFANIAGMSAEQFKKAFEEDATSAIAAFVEGLGHAEEKGTTAINLLDEMGIKEVRLRDTLLRVGGAQQLFNDAVELSNKAWRENAALTAEADKRYETFDSKVQMLKNRFYDMAITVGDVFKQALSEIIDSAEPFIQALEKMANGFASLDEETQMFIAKSAMVAAALATIGGPMLIIGGKTLPTFSKALRYSVTNGLSPFATKMGALMTGGSGLPFFGKALGSAGSGMTALGGATGGAVVGLGTIAAVVAVVIAALGAMALAFYENTYQVRELLSSFWNAIKDTFSQIGNTVESNTNAWKPLVDILKGVVEIIGAAVWYTFISSLAATADIIRITINLAMALLNAFMAVSNAVEIIGFAMVGNFDAVKERSAALVDNVKGVGKNIASAFDPANSALINTYKNMGKTAEATEKVTKTFKVSNNEFENMLTNINTASEATASSLEKASTAVTENLMNTVDATGEALSGQTKKFLQNVADLYATYQEQSAAASQKATEAIAAAEQLSGEERLQALQEANSEYVKSIQENNELLLATYSDYNSILKSNQWADGTELTEQQRELLQQQTEAIRQELATQNELYVQAQLLRIQSGEELAAQEQQTAIEVLKSAYAERATALEEGENALEELRQAKRDATNETEKANYQIQIDEQINQNNIMKENLAAWGSQMIELMANNGTLTAESWGQGISAMGELSDVQLAALYTAFVSKTGLIEDAMGGFAQVMAIKGGDAAQNFVTAIQNGDYEGAAAMVNDEIIGIIQKLPPDMFKNGDKGQKDFITALKSGDFDEAGKYLSGTVIDGIDSKSKYFPDTGKRQAKDYSNEIKNGKSGARSAGEEISSSAASGVSSGDGDMRSAGAGNASAAKSGYSSVGGWYDVGLNTSSGIASGIRGGAGAITGAAMAVAQQALAAAKSKLEVKSPSRRARREIGVMFSRGLALGITDGEQEAINAADKLAENLMDTFYINPDVSTLYDNLKTAITGLNSDIDFESRIQQGASNYMYYNFYGPLVGQANMTTTESVSTLARQLQQNLTNRNKARGIVVPT